MIAGPRRRDRRLPWTAASFVALDFETTGLDLANDSVISFGLVPVDGGRVVLGGARYATVAPVVEPSPSSIAVHGLMPDTLTSAPPLSAVRSVLAESLERRFLVTWAGTIEAAFLSRILGGSQRRWLARTVDVRPLAKALRRRSDAPGQGSIRGLEDTVARFGLPAERAHHAFDDALMTAELFLAVATKLGPHGFGSVRSLLRESRRGGIRSPWTTSSSARSTT
jgi:DNA polymerase-3 subunit epsilon